MTKRLTATIHGITVNTVSDEELAEIIESQDLDGIEEFKEQSEAATRRAIGQSFDDSLELLEVVVNVEEVEEGNHHNEHLEDLDDGGGCMETAEEMNEVRDA